MAPPSTVITWPVKYEALSLASISAISAISSGCPRCLIGWRSSRSLSRASSFQ